MIESTSFWRAAFGAACMLAVLLASWQSYDEVPRANAQNDNPSDLTQEQQHALLNRAAGIETGRVEGGHQSRIRVLSVDAAVAAVLRRLCSHSYGYPATDRVASARWDGIDYGCNARIVVPGANRIGRVALSIEALGYNHPIGRIEASTPGAWQRVVFEVMGRTQAETDQGMRNLLARLGSRVQPMDSNGLTVMDIRGTSVAVNRDAELSPWSDYRTTVAVPIDSPLLRHLDLR